MVRVSFQLQTCSTLHPRVGILLNISENHLDFHQGHGRVQCQMRLFANQTEAGSRCALGQHG